MQNMVLSIREIKNKPLRDEKLTAHWGKKG